MDLTVREMGVGDLGGKAGTANVEAYLGRLMVYSTHLDAKDTEGLATALARNISRTDKVQDKAGS